MSPSRSVPRAVYLENEDHQVILVFRDCPEVLVRTVLQAGRAQHQTLLVYRRGYSSPRRAYHVHKAHVAFLDILDFQEIREILVYLENLVLTDFVVNLEKMDRQAQSVRQVQLGHLATKVSLHTLMLFLVHQVIQVTRARGVRLATQDQMVRMVTVDHLAKKVGLDHRVHQVQ